MSGVYTDGLSPTKEKYMKVLILTTISILLGMRLVTFTLGLAGVLS